jgi:excisionase family DNA binding protein
MPITLNQETYYTAKEVAIKFNISMETVREWRKTKGLRYYKVGDRKFYYSETELENFIRNIK